MNVLDNTGAPLGNINPRTGVVTVTWGIKNWRLEAPRDESTTGPDRRHWVPCDDCGKLVAVAWDVIEHRCDDCTERVGGGHVVFEPDARRHVTSDQVSREFHMGRGGDLCTRCGGPIDHNDPHTYCGSCA